MNRYVVVVREYATVRLDRWAGNVTRCTVRGCVDLDQLGAPEPRATTGDRGLDQYLDRTAPE